MSAVHSSSSFPTFLLYEILLDFHNDRKTLHSCILVNRAWCRITIPLLWRNPIKLLHGPDDYYPYHKYRNNHVKLVDTYLRYLNEEERTELAKDGFILGISHTISPLFDYIYFLRYVSNSDLQMIISNLWNIVRNKLGKKSQIINSRISTRVSPITNDYYTADVLLKSETIHHILSKLIINHCPVIKHLQSTSTLLGPSTTTNNDVEILLKYPRIKECLSNLKIFESRSNFYRGTSFDILSEICHELHTIEVSSCNPLHLSSEDELDDVGEIQALSESQKLSNLIRAQTCLRELILWNCKVRIFDIINTLVSTQQNSLRTFSFNHCDFQDSIWLQVLSEFPNLESLTFNQCINLSNQTSTKLYLPNIKKLKFIYGYISPQVLITLIEATKDSLIELDTGVPHFIYNWINFDLRKYNYLESINLFKQIKLCHNLTSLTTYIYTYTQEQLLNTLLSLDHLKKLVLTEICYSSETESRNLILFSDFLPILASHLSPTVQLLHIGTKFGIKKDALEGFKKNCLSKFKKIGILGGLNWDLENQKVEFEGIFEKWDIDDLKRNLIPNYGVIFSV
ncbi:6640_t:CDS:2 [Diversispora eburnea]|uniref:6640_t:CDS:1 n=1 Tax=Diversispora eburnea TaxID=1213867 RepID=A0A9N8VLW8_9GLOM|nr:6640_t:CDS:2 [Diversispora eburnea]